MLPPPIRLAVIGAGHHSRTFHLPALAHYRRQHPQAITFAALVDPNLATATAAAAAFEFDVAHADVEAMFDQARPDACLVITPVEFNAAVTTQMVGRGLPVLMEKPLGATIGESHELVRRLAALDARVMVSMNRRFDPLLRAALAWIGGRPIRQVKATMMRPNRTEPEFIEHTGLHVVDVVRAIGGAVASCRPHRRPGGGRDWFQAELVFTSGATGLVDLMPAAGATSEFLELVGEDFRVEVRSAEFDRGNWCAWSGDRLEKEGALPPSTPLFIANGTLAETEAFLHALQNGRPLSPSPAEVLPGMELCHAVANVGT